MTTTDKNQIRTLVMEQLASSGLSNNKFATRLGINQSTLSQIINQQWDNISEKKWQEVAAEVGFKTVGWQIAETRDYVLTQERLRFCQDKGISLGMSDNAGIGKTLVLSTYAKNNKEVFYVECADYLTRKVFLSKLMQTMGLEHEGLSIAMMMEVIINHLKGLNKPLVILDELDKLKDGALLLYIDLYNKLNGFCGFFVAGTPYLRLYVEKQARRDKKGFKEILSRLGGFFLSMNGIKPTDITKICHVNGVNSQEEITRIINSCGNDLRRVKREVEKLKIAA
jgi:predicted XRE-type DNA-binding protein